MRRDGEARGMKQKYRERCNEVRSESKVTLLSDEDTKKSTSADDDLDDSSYRAADSPRCRGGRWHPSPVAGAGIPRRRQYLEFAPAT
jgi:hypothetical protein